MRPKCAIMVIQQWEKPMPDIPLFQAAKQAEELYKTGAIVHQKFTCAKCGARQTMDEANVFFTKGECEECKHITDLIDRGCGYAVILGANR